jgi:hypothetical protein
MICRLALLLAVIAVPLAVASTAAANTIEKATFNFSYGPEDTGITCGSGATAFDVYDSATVARNDVSYFDDNGNFIRTIRHETKVGELSNPLTGATVPYTSRGTITFEGDTMIARGNLQATVAGMGVVWQDTGRFLDSGIGTDNETFVLAGPHDDFAYGFLGQTSVAEKLCAALGAT